MIEGLDVTALEKMILRDTSFSEEPILQSQPSPERKNGNSIGNQEKRTIILHNESSIGEIPVETLVRETRRGQVHDKPHFNNMKAATLNNCSNSSESTYSSKTSSGEAASLGEVSCAEVVRSRANEQRKDKKDTHVLTAQFKNTTELIQVQPRFIFVESVKNNESGSSLAAALPDMDKTINTTIEGGLSMHIAQIEKDLQSEFGGEIGNGILFIDEDN